MARIERCPTCHRRIVRSSAANARYWLLLHQISEHVAPGGHSYSPEVWHTWAKSRWLGCEDIRLPNGKTVTVPHSTANLDVGEFSAYLDKIEAWAADRGVFLADMEQA